jgi:organic hydroperoxide reductase OsmC/OhrA
MSEHHATVSWTRTSKDYTYESYNRDHDWTFGGAPVQASAAPAYRGTATRVNPEEALVAALSSCHMLTFLAIAAKKRLSLDSYEDAAIGYMEKNAAGQLAVTRVTLRPKIAWSSGVTVPQDVLDKLHHDAHAGCFIANSVKTDVTVEPRT